MNNIVSTEIVAYNEFRAQLAELQEYNNSAVFDYNSPKGNKDARSHIHKLRKTKSAVDTCRKKEKAASLEYGRKVDSEAKEIISEIQEMIDVHLLPIQEVEQKEKKRIAKIQEEIERIRNCCNDLDELSAETIEGILNVAQSIEITKEEFNEFTEQAIGAKSVSVTKLESALSAQQKYEAEQAELERLRKEAAEREKKEREKRIAEQAAERAKKEAEEKAAKERVAAEDRAKRIAIETEERLKREAEHKAKEEAERKAKLEANKKHRAKIHNTIKSALVKACGIDEETAKQIIIEIATKNIPHISIDYE